MEVYSVLVTGANRGIGLEFVRQLVCLPKPPKYIFATYRSSDSLSEVTKIKNSSTACHIELIKMDVTKQSDVVAARKIIEKAVGEKGLTLLINNSGVAKVEPFPNVTEENLLTHFTTNTVGPIRVFQEMLPLLQKSVNTNVSVGSMSVSKAAVLNITSLAGSITRTGKEFTQDLVVPGYKMSKAALNMAMAVFASVVKEQGILVVMICPGWVKTDLGGEQAQITTEESISAILTTLATLNDSHQGVFMDRLGNPYPF